VVKLSSVPRLDEISSSESVKAGFRDFLGVCVVADADRADKPLMDRLDIGITGSVSGSSTTLPPGMLWNEYPGVGAS